MPMMLLIDCSSDDVPSSAFPSAPGEIVEAALALVKKHTIDNLTGQGLSHNLTLEASIVQVILLFLEFDAPCASSHV